MNPSASTNDHLRPGQSPAGTRSSSQTSASPTSPPPVNTITFDERMLEACRLVGVLPAELDSKLLADFRYGPSGDKRSGNPEDVPDFVLRRRLQNYEQMRQRKLQLVLAQRDKMAAATTGPSSEVDTRDPYSGSSSVLRAPPLSTSATGAIPRPPADVPARYERRQRPTPDVKPLTLDLLKDTKESSRGQETASAAGNSYTSSDRRYSPRAPPPVAAAVSASPRPSVTEKILESTRQACWERAMRDARTQRAADLRQQEELRLLKESMAVTHRQEDEQYKIDQQRRVASVTNQDQALKREMRDERLREMRQRKLSAEEHMRRVECENREKALESVRQRHEAMLAEKAESTRRRNEEHMRRAAERQELMQVEREITWERKGLLELPVADSPTSIAMSQTTATQRRLKEIESATKFEAKHVRELNTIEAAQRIAEQERRRILAKIQKKERRSKRHQKHVNSHVENKLSTQGSVVDQHIVAVQSRRDDQDQKEREYREMLTLEQDRRAEDRLLRLTVERQLKHEDLVARDEWRRSVVDRSKRCDELRREDVQRKTDAKLEAASARRQYLLDQMRIIDEGVSAAVEQETSYPRLR